MEQEREVRSQHLCLEVWHRPDGVNRRRSECAQWPKRLFRRSKIATAADVDDHGRGLNVWGVLQDAAYFDQCIEFVRRLLHVAGEKPQRRSRLGHRVPQYPSQNWSDRMEPVLKGGDDAEVAAATANSPEQVGIFIGTDMQRPPLRSDKIGRQEVVACRSILSHESTQPAPERETGHPHRRALAENCRHTGRPRRVVEIPQRETRLRTRHALGGVHRDFFIPDRFTRTPPSVERKPCPPARTARGRS